MLTKTLAPITPTTLRRWLPLLAFSLALLLYLRTLAPGVYVSDFAEFQYQPARLGLPHPNGFPLYMALGWLWSHLPLATVAWRMNALSAVGGALAVALTAAFAGRLSRRASVALLAAGLLALSPTFWYYSLAAERYTLNLALLVAALWTAWEAAQRQTARPALLSALLLGLGLATHPSDALLAPFWLAYLAWRLPAQRRQFKFWALLALAAAMPLLLYAYVPWRWAAFSAWPTLPGVGRSSAVYHGMVHVWYQPELTWSLLRDYIVGLSGYATGLVGGGWRTALPGLVALAPVWAQDVPLALLVLAALGVLRLARIDTALTLAVLGFALLVAVMTAYIEQGKPEAYLLPATWVTLFCAAFALDLAMVGVAWAAGRRSKAGSVTQPITATADANRLEPQRSPRLDALLTIVVAIGLLVLAAQRYPRLDHSRWTETQRTWDVTLDHHPLSEGAALLGHWSDMTPLWYLQQIDRRRPDLLGLFPPDPAQVIEPWLAAGGALFLAAPLNEYAPDLAQRYSLTPWGKLVRIQLPDSSSPCPVLANAADAPPAWPLAVLSWDISAPLTGGESDALRFCWRARADLLPDVFLKLSLRPLAGGPTLEFNEPLLSEWRPKEVVRSEDVGLAVLPVHLPLGALPGRYAVELMPYRLAADDTLTTWPDVSPLALGEVDVAPTVGLTRSRLGAETAPLLAPRSGPLALRAWEVSTQPVRAGDPVRVDLLWQAWEPTTTPLTVTLSFRSLPTGRLAAPPQAFPLPAAQADALPAALLRTTHILPAPRSRGDQRYLVEARLRAGDAWLPWRPTVWLPLGIVQVRDRPHLASTPAGATPIAAMFGDLAELTAYAVQPSARQAGEALTLTLYWRALSEQDRSYTVFVHLVNAAGQLVAQHDGPPANGELPTTVWLAGEIIADTHTLPLPADLPAGVYTLRVGLYDPATGQRLPIVSAAPHADAALELTQVQVTDR